MFAFQNELSKYIEPFNLKNILGDDVLLIKEKAHSYSNKYGEFIFSTKDNKFSEFNESDAHVPIPEGNFVLFLEGNVAYQFVRYLEIYRCRVYMGYNRKLYYRYFNLSGEFIGACNDSEPSISIIDPVQKKKLVDNLNIKMGII